MALDFFAGSCGGEIVFKRKEKYSNFVGASGIATGYPLDTVKVVKKGKKDHSSLIHMSSISMDHWVQ